VLVPAFAPGGLQDESVEKPARVRQVPFGRAGVRHRLDDVVFRFQRLAELFRKRAHLAVAVYPNRSLFLPRLVECGCLDGKLLDSFHATDSEFVSPKKDRARLLRCNQQIA
jgi:hypothetical protein